MLFTIAVLATLASTPISTSPAAFTNGYTQEGVDSLYAILDSAAVVIEKHYRATSRLHTYDTRETGGVRFQKFEKDLGVTLPASLLVRSTWRVTVGIFHRDTTKAGIPADEQPIAPDEEWLKIALLNPTTPGHQPNVSLSVRMEHGRPSRKRRYEFHDYQVHLQLLKENDTVGQEVSSDTATLSTGN